MLGRLSLLQSVIFVCERPERRRRPPGVTSPREDREHAAPEISHRFSSFKADRHWARGMVRLFRILASALFVSSTGSELVAPNSGRTPFRFTVPGERDPGPGRAKDYRTEYF